MFALFNKQNFESIHAGDLENNRENLIDIREVFEYESGHIPQAKNVPMGNLLQQPEKYLDQNTEYKLICQTGVRSARTCAQLSDQGYQIVNVQGGTSAYPGKLQR